MHSSLFNTAQVAYLFQVVQSSCSSGPDASFGSGVAPSLLPLNCLHSILRNDVSCQACAWLHSLRRFGREAPRSFPKEKESQNVNVSTMYDETWGWGSTDSEVTKCQNYIDKTLRAKHHPECPRWDFYTKDAFYKNCAKVVQGDPIGCRAFYTRNCRCPIDYPECRTKPGKYASWTDRKKSIAGKVGMCVSNSEKTAAIKLEQHVRKLNGGPCPTDVVSKATALLVHEYYGCGLDEKPCKCPRDKPRCSHHYTTGMEKPLAQLGFCEGGEQRSWLAQKAHKAYHRQSGGSSVPDLWTAPAVRKCP